MSISTHEQADEQRVELGTGVNRPAIFAAVGLGLLVVTAAIVLHLLPGTSAAPVLVQNTQASVEEKEIISPAPSQMRPHWRQTPTQATTAETVSTPAPPPAPKPKRSIMAAKPAAPVVEVRAPPPTEPPPIPPTAPQPPFKRRQPYSEDELFARLLADSQELDIEAGKGKGTTAKLLKDSQKNEPKKATPPILELVAQRDDLKGLPMRTVANCQASDKEAKAMMVMSREVRSATASRTGRQEASSSSDVFHRGHYLLVYMEKALSRNPQWREDVGVRMLMQMFQPENYPVRLQVVKLLASNKEKNATAALAQWAVFDLNPEVREAAAKALKDRLFAHYRPVLLEALRYPWAPAADHAAEALVALDDREAVSDLVSLLDQPDPLAPTQNKEKKWVMPELVRVNHLGNCVLCHAPSSAKDNTVRGLVPERGQSLPVVYYESQSGNFVRADVTWPVMQRFDYLIRKRELSADEVKQLTPDKKVDDDQPVAYPQRGAVLWALQLLTEHNAGDRSEDWRRYLEEERTKCGP
jgi:hypothetical protein